MLKPGSTKLVTQKSTVLGKNKFDVFKFMVDFSYLDVMYVVLTIGLLIPILIWCVNMCRYVVTWYMWEFKRYKNCVTCSIVVQVGI